MEDDTDEEEMYDVNIDDERELHWRNVFEDNEGGWMTRSCCYMLRGGIYI